MDKTDKYHILTSFFLTLSVLLSIIFLFGFNNKPKPYAESSKFLIEEYSLNDILSKINNKKYDEITQKDKTKVKNLIDIYSKGKYKEVYLTETDWLGNNKTVSLKGLLKYDKKEHNSISIKEEQLRYLVALYKVVVDDDRSYIQDLDENFYLKEQKKSHFSKVLSSCALGFVPLLLFFDILIGVLWDLINEQDFQETKIENKSNE